MSSIAAWHVGLSPAANSPSMPFFLFARSQSTNGLRRARRTADTDVTAAIDGAIAGDAKASRFSLPQADLDTDETGCQYHANAAHHRAMATLLAAEIKTKMGW